MQREERETVIYEKDGPVARIILNRPEKANSQSSAMVWDVEHCLNDAERDYDIKVLVLKANGKGFSAGHDMGAGGGPPYPEFVEAHEAGHPWKGQADLFLWPILHLWEFQKPSISAVQGYAVGGGSYFACIPDIVLAADDAYFQMPLVQGLGFPGGETMMEPYQFMNYHRTYEYLYTAQTLSAEQAREYGMVNRVVPRDQLDHEVEVLARQIAQAPLSTLMATKAGVKRAWEMMGMRVHLQMTVQTMELVGRAGDVAAWRKENFEGGFVGGPRQIAAKRFAAAEAEVLAAEEARSKE